jgi:hypothetical protein
VRIRIEATELPGRTFTPGSDHPRCDNVHVGVQRRGRPDELLDPDVVGAAARSGRLLARVRLTDPKGGPLCARVRPPYVEWSAGQAR